MSWLVATLPVVVAIAFALVSAACVVLVVVQLPGAWIMLGLAVIIELADVAYRDPSEPATFGWLAIIACLVVGLLGELLEFLAGVLGARVGGGSAAGMWGSLVGGIAGAIVLMPLLPVMPLFGALVGGVIGTFVGAVIGEIGITRRRLAASMRPALGAAIGRVLATVGKVGAAVVMWAVLVVAAFV